MERPEKMNFAQCVALGEVLLLMDLGLNSPSSGLLNPSVDRFVATSELRPPARVSAAETPRSVAL